MRKRDKFGPFALADLIRSKRIRKYIGRHICLAGFTPNMKSSEKVNYRDKAFKDGNIYLRNCIGMSPPSQEAPPTEYTFITLKGLGEGVQP